VEGWQGSGYRTRAAFGIAFRLYGAGFNPAHAFLHVLFYWKGDLVSRFRRERSHQSVEAETSTAGITLSDHVIPVRVQWAGRRIITDFGTIGTFQSQSRVSTWLPFISKGEYVFLIRHEQNHRVTRFRPAVPDATCCSLSGHASPEDARMGRRIETSFGSFSFQSRSHAATIAHIGADTPRSFSRREGAIDPRLQLHLIIDVTLTSNQASTGMLAKRDSERMYRFFSDRRFYPRRTFARLPSYREADRRHAILFGMAIEFTPVFETRVLFLIVSNKCGQH